ncbi:MAG: DUF58 domain-containing protein [Thermoflexaceae bacterium]|nr:DUF58 domain-containing protein [Thermoflexaceae bacterium]
MKLWSRTSPATGTESPGDGHAPGIPPELLQRVKLIEIKARRLVDDLFLGEYHAIFRGRGIEFDELRPYVPGDDVRSIDWKAFARTGEPFIRRYREDRDLTVIFAVDVSASQRAGALPRTKGDLAAEICAVLALAAIRNKDRVGLLLFAAEPELYIRPANGAGNVFRVVREMLWPQPRTSGTSIGAALQYLADVQKRRATVFLVSDFLSTGYSASIRSAARRHDLIGIRVREPIDEALPAAGLIRLADSETGAMMEVDSSSVAVREAYAAHIRRLDAERRLLFGQAGIDEIEVEVGVDYVPALLRFFRKRALAVAG